MKTGNTISARGNARLWSNVAVMEKQEEEEERRGWKGEKEDGKVVLNKSVLVTNTHVCSV